MRKIVYLILIAIIIFCMIGCASFSTNEYINQEINIDISKCHILIDNDGHGGFLGDGEYFVKADCSNDSENMLNQIRFWNELPFPEDVQLIMYGGEKNGITYAYNLADKVGIPKIKNGVYLFDDRHIQSDKVFLNRSSYNFTVALYDKDSDIFYYYEYDS